MTVYETDLPGVGKKHEIDLGDDARLVVVTHNTGKREVFRRLTPAEDSEKLFELSDELARQVGTILEGAYFQPVQTDRIETMLGEDTLIEWVDVDADSALSGLTLETANVRQRFGVSIIAIQRGSETIANPGGSTRIEAGDTLIVLGGRDECRSFIEGVSDDD